MHRVFALVVAFALVGVVTAGQEPAVLRLNPEIGKTYRYALKMNLAQEMMGMDLGMVQEAVQTVSVSEDPKGKRFKIGMEDPKVTVPSGSPMEAQVDAMVDGLRGLSMEMVYDSLGKLVDSKVAGGDDASRAMLQAMGSSQMGFFGFEYPKDPVHVGSTWTATFDMTKMLNPGGTEGARKQELVTEYKLLELDAQKVVVEGVANGTFTMEVQGQSMGMAIQSKTKFVLDRVTGMPISTTSTSNNKLSLPVGEMNQTITYSLTLLT